MSGNRDLSLDFMRFAGVLVIMLAHADAPAWVFQLRNFGTPLLIVASALTFSAIYGARTLDATEFLKRRLTRLVAPAWIFLTLFFVTAYLVSVLAHRDFPFSKWQVLTSYTFYSGIGYLWIFKVYLFIAVLTALLLRYKKNIPGDFRYFGCLAIAYIGYELTAYLVNRSIQQGWVLE